jgi:dCMP deaminase
MRVIKFKQHLFGNERIPLINIYMSMAISMSKRSICPINKKHGAIAIKEGRVIAMGYNGPAAGELHCNPCSLISDNIGKDWRTCPAVHAEENVIANAAKYGVAINSCALIVTKKPCNRCTSLLINAGIKEVSYLED